MSRNQTIVISLVAIVAAAAGALLARGMFADSGVPQAAMTAGTVLDPPRALPTFTLVDQDENPATNDSLRGRWTLLAFGFTNCPDVCPATLTQLAQLKKTLADLPEGERPHVVLITADPERDTPQQLRTYVKFFDPTFAGLTGSPEAVERFTRELGVPVAITKSSNGAYTVDHSAAIFLINPDAQFRALFSAPHDINKIGADYRLIVEHG